MAGPSPSLALNAEIHDVVPADGTVVNDDVPSPESLPSCTCFRLEQVTEIYLLFGFWPVLVRFLAKLGPETRSNGPGSENGAERTHINPGDKF